MLRAGLHYIYKFTIYQLKETFIQAELIVQWALKFHLILHVHFGVYLDDSYHIIVFLMVENSGYGPLDVSVW